LNKKSIQSPFKFIIQAKESNSRAKSGIFHTPHGAIHTPFFMPVGTTGFVKTLTPKELQSLGAEIMLSNTYHLYLRPGSKNIKKFGGLHKWIGWDKPILTDSGGFQVFSLHEDRKNPHNQGSDTKTSVKITDKGVEFKSHIDGSLHFFTPENVIKIEHEIGADIIMALDECIPHDANKAYTKNATQRTHKWAMRCKKTHEKLEKSKKNSPAQALFAIIQGGMHKDLRTESAKFITDLDLPGTAIGGLSVGEKHEQMYEALENVYPHINHEKPTYLMGVGSPENILEAVDRGIDMFDCVMPTRLARHGSFWTNAGRFNITNAKYKLDQTPLMKGCACETCQTFTKSYLRHLFTEGETLGLRLMTIHNLHFLLNLMRNIRESIALGKFGKFKKQFLAEFRPKNNE